ncbi:ATP-binding protein [Thalassovita sp.]|uniref:ATP-binding protein n=1 Tax=Thalassovita sp. TaxID=1979401 RepID=UPI0029DE8A64|nr:ATP-binding protein [Thalassovita sp.]
MKTRWLQGGLLAVVSLVALALLLPLWLEVTGKLEEMRTARRDNVIWTITQMEVEYLELEKAVILFQDDGAELIPLVKRRFDIFYSRIKILTESASYRSAIEQAEEVDRLYQIGAGVRALLPLMDGPPVDLLNRREDLLHEIAALRSSVRRVVVGSSFILNTRTEAAREDAVFLMQRLGVASVVLLGGLLGLALLFMRLFIVNKRRAKENLRTSQRLSTVVATSPDAIIVADELGNIRDFNPAAEQMLGYSRAEALTRRITGMIEDEQGNSVMVPFKQTTCYRRRMNGVALTGHRVPLEVSRGVTSLDRQPVHVFFLRDISERLEAEEALRTSRDKALAGERAKAHFLAVMSHEMRTPLNGILGVIELMRGTVRTPKDRHYLSLLEQSGQVLLGHVNEVLDITEIEARGIRLRVAPFDLDKLLHGVVAAQRPAAEAKRNNLTLTVSPEPIGVLMGDAMRLRQIVANLLSNAIKFTENGQVELSVSGAVGAHGMDVEIQVSDTGIGIEDALQARIFDDFVRAGDDLDTRIEGTGLGLGIVRRIVSAMNGTISVDSIRGEGSLFRVRLMLPIASPAQPADLIDETREEQLDSRQMNILLVEDHPTNRFIIKEMLEQGDFAVTEAENGEIGARLAREQHFDVILMDINMPVLSGVEAARLIRSEGASRTSRILALTAHVLDQDAELYREAGIDEVISKPIGRGDLFRVLRGEGALPVVAALGQTLNPAALDQLAKGLTRDRLARVVQGVLDEGDAFVQAVEGETALSREQMIEVFHAFSGVCGMVGAERMRNSVSRLEDSLRNSQQVVLQDWQQPLAELWRETRAALETRTAA